MALKSLVAPQIAEELPAQDAPLTQGARTLRQFPQDARAADHLGHGVEEPLGVGDDGRGAGEVEPLAEAVEHGKASLELLALGEAQGPRQVPARVQGPVWRRRSALFGLALVQLVEEVRPPRGDGPGLFHELERQLVERPAHCSHAPLALLAVACVVQGEEQQLVGLVAVEVQRILRHFLQPLAQVPVDATVRRLPVLPLDLVDMRADDDDMRAPRVHEDGGEPKVERAGWFRHRVVADTGPIRQVKHQAIQTEGREEDVRHVVVKVVAREVPRLHHDRMPLLLSSTLGHARRGHRPHNQVHRHL
mmetsp:Transcript_82836/g.268365  ORF Transcript_82836/g.268365 Transcript_82836/m.268365 type:complete len:305 (-) Transcript_82836:102-1016(-)